MMDNLNTTYINIEKKKFLNFEDRKNIINKIEETDLTIVELFKSNNNNKEYEQLLNTHTEYRKLLIDKCEEKSVVFKIYSLFLSIFYNKDLNDHINKIKLFKKVNKLIEKSRPEYLLAYHNHKYDLDNLLFYNQVFYKMIHFGHEFKVNSEGQPIFKFNQTFKPSLSQTAHKMKLEDWTEFKETILKEFPEGEPIYVDYKRTLNDSCSNYRNERFEKVQINDWSAEQFKYHLIYTLSGTSPTFYSTRELTLDELKEKEFNHYGENGFVKKEDESYIAQQFLPYSHTQNPPQDFTLDVIVHSPPGGSGIFSNQGHASIRITTPGGEIYSIGFGGYTREGLNYGSFSSPDPSIFVPEHAVVQHKKSYTLPNARSFHLLMDWLEESIKENNKGIHYYHFSDHNCSFFADKVRRKAMQLGAKSSPCNGKKFSKLERASISIKKILLYILIKNPLGKYLCKSDKPLFEGEDYNINRLQEKMFYFPIDLLLDDPC